MVDTWLRLFVEAENLDPETPPSWATQAEIREVMEIMAAFTQKERERDIYERRREYRRMIIDIQADAIAKGEARGEAHGEHKKFSRLQRSSRHAA